MVHVPVSGIEKCLGKMHHWVCFKSTIGKNEMRQEDSS